MVVTWSIVGEKAVVCHLEYKANDSCILGQALHAWYTLAWVHDEGGLCRARSRGTSSWLMTSNLAGGFDQDWIGGMFQNPQAPILNSNLADPHFQVFQQTRSLSQAHCFGTPEIDARGPIASEFLEADLFLGNGASMGIESLGWVGGCGLGDFAVLKVVVVRADEETLRDCPPGTARTLKGRSNVGSLITIPCHLNESSKILEKAARCTGWCYGPSRT